MSHLDNLWVANKWSETAVNQSLVHIQYESEFISLLLINTKLLLHSSSQIGEVRFVILYNFLKYDMEVSFWPLQYYSKVRNLWLFKG
jgi:hypothetical protein